MPVDCMLVCGRAAVDYLECPDGDHYFLNRVEEERRKRNEN
jgi:hypothetical protein